MAAGFVTESAEAACSTPTEGGTVTCSDFVNAPPVVIADFGTISIIQNASFNTDLSVLRIGTVPEFRNTGNLQNLTIADIGTLNINFSGGNVNGTIVIDRVVTLDMTSAINLPDITFTDVGDLTLALTGGNVNGTVRVVRGGTVDITNQIIANRFELEVATGLTFENTGTINNGILLSGVGASTIINRQNAFMNSGVLSTGGSVDTVDNYGVIQGGTFDLGGGNDIVINRPTADPMQGRIDSDVNLGDGEDTFTMLGGLVRRVNAGAGNDTASIQGGTVDDFYHGQDGNDSLTWTGGQIRNIDMGDGVDTALFSNLPAASLDYANSVSGGLDGVDRLTFDATAADRPSRFTAWELVELNNGSSMRLGGGTLTLGDAGTLAGRLTIDGTSTLLADNGENFVSPAVAPNPVSVVNFGTIDLHTGSPSINDRLTIGGNYQGVAGSRLRVDTFLDTDGSPSDLLRISGGAATGRTALIVTNAGGGGAPTIGDGILVVQTTDNGTTAPGTFGPTLAIAGPYEYVLYRGGLNGGSPNDWFLRSTINCFVINPPSPPCRDGPTPPGPDPDPDPDPDPTPDPTPDPDVIPPGPNPHYRQEVSLYTAIPPATAIYDRNLIGTLHTRVGSEEPLGEMGDRTSFNGGWARIVGHAGQHEGHARGIFGGGPEFDYRFGYLQAGLDLYGMEHGSGARDFAGLYFAFGHGAVDVTHNLLGFEFPGGTNSFNAYTVGGYWTHFGPEDWYLDAVVQGTFYDITARSRRDAILGFPDQHVDGTGFAASLEGGYPFRLGGGWLLEPQAQLVYQNVSFGTLNDGAAEVSFGAIDSLSGRLGAALAYSWAPGASADLKSETSRKATIWGRADLWHNFLDGKVTTSFSSAAGPVPFTAELPRTWYRLGIGASYQVTHSATLYGDVDYEATFDGKHSGFNAIFGVRMNW